MLLTDRTVMVSGGASGLGLAVASRVVAEGGRVAILDLPSTAGAQVAADLGEAAMFLPADVTSEEDVRTALDSTQERFGTVSAAVTCAGIVDVGRTVGRGGAFALDRFRRVLDVNVAGTFNVARLVAEQMQSAPVGEDGDRGVIVMVASISGLDGPEGQVAYTASKAAVAGMTISMARDLARHAIRVVAVAPGTFETPMVMASTPAEVDAIVSTVPHPHRLGRPEEFARTVRDLIENTFINGSVVRLDGGNRLR